MIDKASKVICVDQEVFELIRKNCKGKSTPNNYLRELLNLPLKSIKVGRPYKVAEIK